VQVGAGETYFSAFALFLNATAAQVALLSTLPPLLGSSAQIFSAWLGTHFGRRRLVLWGCTLQALLWLPILLVPLLFAPFAIPALLVLLALYQGANNLSAPQWTSIMRDLVSERRRGRYFGYRTQVTTVTTFIALVICGVILDEVDKSGATYLGFVVIFAVAFVARTVSVYHLTFLYEPAQHGATPDMHIEHWWRSLLSTGAIGFSVYFALMNAAVGISSRSSPCTCCGSEAQLSRVHSVVRRERVRAVPDAQHLGPACRRLRQPTDPDRDERVAARDSAALAALG
jgi:MFS family permease